MEILTLLSVITFTSFMFTAEVIDDHVTASQEESVVEIHDMAQTEEPNESD